jgi:hypothetical protein
MDIVKRAYFQARREATLEMGWPSFEGLMIRNMVHWIKLRVYSKRDWPREFGEYPQHLEKDVER